MTTRFSFSGAHAWASGPNGRLEEWKTGVLQKAQARWQSWREERDSGACGGAWKSPGYQAGNLLRRNRWKSGSIE